jgi:isoquinoline 1-oxidoreductase alpha subunit
MLGFPENSVKAYMIKLTINGTQQQLDVDPDMPLLWAIRDHAGLTGTKYGCAMSLCGACTVHLDGAAVRACVTPVSEAAGRSVTTIERLDSPHGSGRAGCLGKTGRGAVRLLPVWADHVRRRSVQPQSQASDADITAAMNGNLCRCSTYARIRAAIKAAAGALSAGEARS